MIYFQKSRGHPKTCCTIIVNSNGEMYLLYKTISALFHLSTVRENAKSHIVCLNLIRLGIIKEGYINA